MKKASRMEEWVKKLNKQPHPVPNEMMKSRWLSVSWEPEINSLLVKFGVLEANCIDWH